MHAVHIHIDETLDAEQLHGLEDVLMHRPHVAQVLSHERMPHDLLVEYDEHFIHPLDILSSIAHTGLHPDVTYC